MTVSYNNFINFWLLTLTVYYAMKPTDKDRFTGSILGTMVGDALGAGVEFWPCEDLNDTLDRIAMGTPTQEDMLYVHVIGMLVRPVPPGTAKYSDDSEMTLGVAESLAALGHTDPADLAQRFAQNYHPWRGYGMAAAGVLEAIRNGAVWNEPAQKVFNGEGSFGNGAAMRVAPVGLFFSGTDNASVAEAARHQSLPTHTHILGIEGAIWQAIAVATAINCDPHDFAPTDFLDAIRPHLTQGIYHEKLDEIATLLTREPQPCAVAEILGTGIEAHEAVPAALFSFLSRWDSFADAVLYAVRLGGDTDTIGAMTGAISGAFHGASAIPQNWLDGLEDGYMGRTYAVALAESLYDASIKKIN
jgi:poly(ADP-ribose) glycohydrolase ARH3